MTPRLLDSNTRASDPGGIQLSHDKIRRFHPDLFQPEGWRRMFGLLSPTQKELIQHFEEHLLYADSRAAIVVTADPLRVAAYTDEIDCVAMLAFPLWVAQQYNLQPGSRLLTVNTYRPGSSIAPDLVGGPGHLGRYANFHPVIAEFFSDQRPLIEQRKGAIADQEWARTAELAQDYAARFGDLARSGYPFASGVPIA